MAVKPELLFLPNDADETEGLGDAGIESYRDSPYSSLARECGQNSNDAAVTPPVTVSYDVIEVPSADIPGVEQLRTAISACLKAATDSRDEKAIDFFRHAKHVIGGQRVRVMRVADYNTHGLIGPCRDNTPFHSLLKGAGVSKKGSDTSGGSFGIGKNAAFAVSDLQTVFYSTIYVDGESGKEQFLAQGKALLISHVDANGRKRRAKGYWGFPEGFMPVGDPKLVPAWLRRTQVGTSVFAIGFREVADWEYRMIYSLLTNFFVAVWRGLMVFRIGDPGTTLDANTIDRLFNDPRVEQAARDDGHFEAFQFARDLYRCLISAEAVERTATIDGLGEVTIRVLVTEGLPKRVAIIRNGMMITDSLEHFGDKFARFPLYRDFVAIVEPREQTGRALLKTLENIRHDGLSAERIPDPQKREAARRVMVRLADKIRETIRAETTVSHDSEVPLDEMSEFFSEGNSDDRPPEKDAEKDLKTIIYEPAQPKRTRKAAPGGHGTQGGAGGGGGGGGNGGGTGKGKGRGTGGKGDRGEVRPVGLYEVRHTPSPDRKPNRRTVYFTPDTSGIANITFEASGVNNSEKLDVIGADKGKPIMGSLWVAVEEGKRNALNIEFAVDYDGPVEMTAVRVADAPGGAQ